MSSDADGPYGPSLVPYEAKPGELVSEPLQPPQPAKAWNGPEHFAQSQRWIAYWLLGVLSASVVIPWIALFCNMPLPKVQELTTMTFAPIVGLVGAVTGFYFGERNAERRRMQEPTKRR